MAIERPMELLQSGVDAIPPYIHKRTDAGQYNLIINLKVPKEEKNSRVFYYDLDLVNVSSSGADSTPGVNLILRMNISSTGIPNVKAHKLYIGLHKDPKQKLFYQLTQDGEGNIYLKVFLANVGQTYTKIGVKANFISNLECNDSLKVAIKDVYTQSEIDAMSDLVEIEERYWTAAYNIVSCDKIQKNKNTDNIIKIGSSLMPSSDSQITLGSPDKTIKSIFVSNYMKIPIQGAKWLVEHVPSLGANGVICFCPNTRKTVIYHMSRWYDMMGNDITAEMEAYTSTTPSEGEGGDSNDSNI